MNAAATRRKQIVWWRVWCEVCLNNYSIIPRISLSEPRTDWLTVCEGNIQYGRQAWDQSQFAMGMPVGWTNSRMVKARERKIVLKKK
jgi:hypothetical protein